jgi:heme/copper-type cytochrome/quinol oxidase subunit 2
MILHHVWSLVAQGVDLTPLPKPAADPATMQKILTTVFGIFAAVALLVIVISGVRYVFSSGDPNTAATTKKTIIYASVGLVVSMLAFASVGFVLSHL